MNFTQDYEVKETGQEALAEMQRWAADDDIFHPGYGVNLFQRFNTIFYKNLDIADRDGLGKAAREISKQHILKILGRYNALFEQD